MLCFMYKNVAIIVCRVITSLTKLDSVPGGHQYESRQTTLTSQGGEVGRNERAVLL